MGQRRDSTPDSDPGHLVAVLAIPCQPPSGPTVIHHASLWADGSFRIDEHDAEPWGRNEEVAHALGGPLPTSGCLWLVNATDSGDGQWVAGSYLPEQHHGWVSPYTWRLRPEGEWTEAAVDALMVRLGVDRETPPRWTPAADPYDTFTTVKAISPHLRAPTRLHWAVLDAVVARQPAEVTVDWLVAGVPWDQVDPLTHQGADLQVAAGIHAEVLARVAAYPLDRYSLEVTSSAIGTAAYWYRSLANCQVAPERMVPFMARTRTSGRLYWREKAYALLLAGLDAAGRRFPAGWVAEAVLALPDRDILAAGGQPGQWNADFGPTDQRSPEWARAWVEQAAVPRMLALFLAHGDPAGWPDGWQHPTADELATDYREA